MELQTALIGLGVCVGILIGLGFDRLISHWFEKSIEKINKEYVDGLKSIITDADKEINELVEYKAKYEALTAELNDMAKKYPLFKPVQRVVDAKQQGVKFEKDELCGLLGFKIKDEEGGV